MMKTLILSGVMLFNAVAANAGERLSVRVSPALAHAPADIIVYVTLERNAENRLLRVSAESDDFFRSSEVTLDGEDNARVMILHFLQLPPGAYSVTVDVKGVNGQTKGRARCEVNVL